MIGTHYNTNAQQYRSLETRGAIVYIGRMCDNDEFDPLNKCYRDNVQPAFFFQYCACYAHPEYTALILG